LSLAHLHTTARALRSAYQITITLVFFYHLATRRKARSRGALRRDMHDEVD
jgi:hypothetical protein